MASPSATIFGEVRSIDGRPLAGAQVRLEPTRPPNRDFQAEGLTHADGTFRLSVSLEAREAVNPRSWTWRLEVSALGRTRQVVQLEELAPGETRTVGAVVLDVERTVTGRLLSPAGRALAGGRVELRMHSALPGTSPWSAESDRHGNFILRHVPGGSFALDLHHPAYSPRTVLGIEVGAADVDLGDLALAAGTVLTGQVVDPAGKPLADVEVELWVRGRSSDEPRTATTDADGRYRLPALRPDATVTLYFSRPGFLRQPYGARQLSGEAAEQELPRIRLEAARRLRGRVVDGAGEPIAGARVAPYWQQGSAHRIIVEHRTDEDGRFDLQGLEAGDYTVSVRAPGFRPASFESRSRPATSTQENEVRLERIETAELELEVVTEAGKAVMGATVRVSRTQGLPFFHHQATTGEDGRVRVAHVPPGRYQVVVDDDDHPRLERSDIELTAAGRFLRLTLAAPTWTWVEVTGRVTGPEDRPVSGAKVLLSRQLPDYGYFTFHTGHHGTFAGRVKDGVYTVEVRAQGFAPLDDPERQLPLYGPESDPIELVVERGATIFGTLEGLPEHRLPEITVGAAGEGGVRVVGFVSAGGTYRVPNVPPGQWTVTAADPQGHRVASGQAEVTPGATRFELPLHFAAAGRLDGTAVYRGEPLAGVYVILKSEGRHASWGATTEADGRFAFADVTDGDYVLEVFDGATRLHWQSLRVDGDAELEVAIGAARVSGEVVDATDGRPIADVRLRAWSRNPPPVSSARVPEPVVDGDGRFLAAPLEAGTWSFQASAPGYRRREISVEVRDALDVAGVRIELEPAVGLRLVVRSAGSAALGSVQARLVDSEGQRVAHTVLELTQGSRVQWDDVPEGRFTLVVEEHLGGVVRQPVRIPGPEVEVTVPAAGIVRVRIRRLETGDAEPLLELETVDPPGPFGADRHRPRTSFHRHRRAVVVQGAPGTYLLRVTAAGIGTWNELVTIEDGRVLEQVVD